MSSLIGEIQAALKVFAADRDRYREALEDLLAASAPYMTDAMPHEQLFSGTDLRNFEAFAAARQRAVCALGECRERPS